MDLGRAIHRAAVPTSDAPRSRDLQYARGPAFEISPRRVGQLRVNLLSVPNGQPAPQYPNASFMTRQLSPDGIHRRNWAT